MKVKEMEFDFPAVSMISFDRIFESLEKMANEDSESVSTFAKQLLKDLEPYPELREGIPDYEGLKPYWDQVQLLSRALFPDVLLTNEIKGLCAPFQFESFYNSTRFQNILDAAGKDYQHENKLLDPDLMYIVGCVTILAMHYGYNADFTRPFIMKIPNAQGQMRFYRLAFNADLIDIIPTDKAKKITEEDFHELLDQMDNIEIWKEKFPKDSYIMKGIGIINLFDVTIDQSLSMISSNLLTKTPDLFEKLTDNVRALFNIPDLQVGFLGMKNNSLEAPPHKGHVSSILLSDQESHSCDGMFCEYAEDKLFNKHEPLAISDVDRYVKLSNVKLGKYLKKKGIQSYVMAPMIHDDQLLGYLELGSTRKRELNSLSVSKLQQLLPILAMAASRFEEEAKNKIEAIIQEECTTIHQSVKWRFEEEATNYLHKQEAGEQPSFKDIIFKDVYPLYGQTDIKGSSTIRNEAVIKDLTSQLNEVRIILEKAYELKHLPTFEELMFRIDTFLLELNDELMAGSEHKILGFLKSEIYPVFGHLKSLHPSLDKMIKHYKSLLNKEMDIIYNARRDFDESVTRINQTLAAFIDEKQIEAQSMFPHYFERYKTDGVEYNMYIGQSITNLETFDPLYLTNLRLWQLIVMCDMENEFHRLQKDLKTPLEVASLVLAYNTPLSIHFRLDEKRFDVEGAYNARYEIVKKRVDKAHIKGTDERITQPGKIVVIYTTRQDETEYKKHFRFLASKGYIDFDSIEQLELENLQGITGLKALRVAVNYADGDNRSSVTYEQLINEISNKE